MITIDKLTEIIKRLAPTQFNSIIIDDAAAIKEYNYCYIKAFTQKITYSEECLHLAADSELKKQLDAAIAAAGDRPFFPVEPSLLMQLRSAPKASSAGLLSSTKKKINALIDGGRKVDHHLLSLLTDGDKLDSVQPTFAVTQDCSTESCSNCNALGIITREKADGTVTNDECRACKGRGHTARVTLVTPSVKSKTTNIVRCLEGDIDQLKFSANDDGAALKEHEYAIPAGVTTRMLAHFNGTDIEDYDPALRPYIDILHDRTGEDNAIEDIFFKIIPCYTFRYRNIITSNIVTGVLIDPFGDPYLALGSSSARGKIGTGMKYSIKTIGNFFGSIGRTSGYKDKEDLRRTIRLLVAVAVADGSVSEEEKQSLTLAIRNIDQLTAAEQDSLLTLLGSSDASFLTDNDFLFHSRENAEETLVRMQQLAASDGLVNEVERDIIERLKFRY